MATQISEDVQKVLDIIGDTPENREKLLPIVEELQAAGKEVGLSEKADPCPEEEEEEKKAKKPEEEEEEEEEKQRGGLVGAILDKLNALKGKVPDDVKADVTEIINLARSLQKAGRYPYPYPYPEAKDVAELLKAGVLEELRQGLDTSVSGLFQQWAERVEALEGQVKEEQEFSQRFRGLLASQPKSTLRPSEAQETRVVEDDKTVQALKSDKPREVLPGFIGRRLQVEEE